MKKWTIIAGLPLLAAFLLLAHYYHDVYHHHQIKVGDGICSSLGNE